MKFNVKLLSIEKLETEALAVFLWEDEKEWLKEALELDKILGGLLKRIVGEEEFKAKIGQILSFHTHGKLGASRVLICGLGKREEFDPSQIRSLFSGLGRRANQLKIKNLGFGLSFAKRTKFDLKQFSQGVVEGLILGTYKFLKYKGEKEKAEIRELETVEVATEKVSDLVLIKEGVSRGEIFAEATILARDLVNEPGSVTTPTYLAQTAKKMAGGLVRCQVFDKVQMVKMGLGGILGVARGSEEQPKLIRLDYNPPGARKKIVLVGKAITFDTGGLSLKPPEALETMKLDMAGGAAILGVFSVLAKMKAKVWVVGFIPATENMPSGKALKPGDILKAHNGKTIEVVNTDAEGRLILADALSLGVDEKPQFLLDLATLTGACMVALGDRVAGLFATDEKFEETVKKSASEVGEDVWSLPLVKDYKELLKSEVADLRNISKSRYGGAITAALFLQEFVGTTPWVHIDIAGPSFAEKPSSLVSHGGSGFGARTVLNLLEKL